MKSRSLDKCLDDFNHFHITLEETDGDVIWGKLKVYSTGFVLKFDNPVEDNDGFLNTSYILYESQFSTIHTLYRFHDELSEENKKKRDKIIKRAYSTAIIYKIIRRFRGIINTFRDAIVKSITIIIGQMQKVNPGSVILKSQKQNLSTISSDIVGYVGNAYDPILEDLIGELVIVDLSLNEAKRSFMGLFMEYSDQFMVINDIHDTLNYRIPLHSKPIKFVSKYLKIKREDGEKFLLENSGELPFTILKIEGKGKSNTGEDESIESELNKILKPNSKEIIEFPKLNYDELYVSLSVKREFDLILPRKKAIIRHESEKKDEK